MIEFLLAWVRLLPTLPAEWREYRWKGEDPGTISGIGNLYNQGVTDGRYVYHYGKMLSDEDLTLSWKGFDWSRYVTSEKEVLEPQLAELGFSNFRWMRGESDSFGTLSRYCTMTDRFGQRVEFVYG